MSAGILKKAVVLAVAGFAFVLATPTTASATTVSYSTKGGFNGTPVFPGQSPISHTFGTGAAAITVTFTGAPTTISTADPVAGAVFGSFKQSGGNGTLTGVSGVFDLYITQNLPIVGGATITGVLSGTISFRGGVGFVAFDTTPVTIGTGVDAVSYQAIPTLLSPSNNPTPSSVNGIITAAAVPEPASMVMCGLGLMAVSGVAFLRRRRRSLVAIA